MGISRDSRHKHRATGGVRAIHQKKRQFELGRPAAMTKLGNRRVRVVRCRGGNLKFRALRLDTGNYSWGSEGVSRKTRILNTVYNASNNELVRTNTLVKNTIVQIDAAPFKQWYEQHFGIELSKKGAEVVEETCKSNSVVAKLKAHRADRYLDPAVEEQFAAGRLLACISSRPGQSGRADGYILEGEELAFYMRKLEKKGKK
ncbi:40S ribosomal protein [Perkinsus olseni]|uniref:40S ribosomal protein S8 n=1 Tax=Perkinsus olseni TaxID=32597 RepID=A0A7J6MHL5_PEROL|nr:40S ribosomal protein [Perkinsus olseni]KAF4675908.1 40S ribosomal protein [Perkinsus olseni]